MRVLSCPIVGAGAFIVLVPNLAHAQASIVVLQGAFVATVNAEMHVGTLEETMTSAQLDL
jgi:hypothetical protein